MFGSTKIECQVASFCLLLSLFSLASSQQLNCQSMEQVSLCQHMPYNTSMFPNILNHRNILEATKHLDNFSPLRALVKLECSKDLAFFLCTVFIPVCVKYGPIQPCKSLCERARKGCGGIMKKFGFIWPDFLRCDRYPEKKERENVLCVDENDNHQTTTNNNYNQNNYTSKFICPALQLIDSEHYHFMGIKECASNCTTIYFTPKEKEFARVWILFWSVVCVFSTAFTILTFIVDMPRFRYPERPIIFLSGCYFMIAIAFISGSISGEAVACHTSSKTNAKLLNQGTDHASCTFVFMLVYFFLMSASIWWVILTLTWFLAAGLKWGHEAIEASSQYFHAAAWAIPAAKTIAILAMNRMDGDMLSGLCFVGNSDLNALRGFVLAPLFVYLVVGSFFLLAGFVALIRIRKVLKTDQALRTDKLTRLMVRIGIFSILYSLPAIIVIACLFYEQSFRPYWDESWKNGWLKMLDDCDGVNCKDFVYKNTNRPDFAVFMIKYLMLLMVGITSGFWIWSGKTIQSWRRFYYNKLLNQRVPRYHYESRENSVHTNLTKASGLTARTKI